MMAQKLVENKGMNSPWTLASLSDKDITATYEVIKKPGGLMGKRTTDRRNQISFACGKEPQLQSIYVQVDGMFLQSLCH